MRPTLSEASSAKDLPGFVARPKPNSKNALLSRESNRAARSGLGGVPCESVQRHGWRWRAYMDVFTASFGRHTVQAAARPPERLFQLAALSRAMRTSSGGCVENIFAICPPRIPKVL